MPSCSVLSESLGRSVINCPCAGCGLNTARCGVRVSVPTGPCRCCSLGDFSSLTLCCSPSPGWGEDRPHPVGMKTKNEM